MASDKIDGIPNYVCHHKYYSTTWSLPFIPRLYMTFPRPRPLRVTNDPGES
jgi:hypothetical protein